MEAKSESQGTEHHKSPEPQDTPEHQFVRDQLAGISFLNPETQKRVTLKQRLGKIFPMYEAQVIAEFDRLKALEGNKIASKYEDDAKRRARMAYRDWKNEQRKINKSYDDLVYDEAQDDYVIDEGAEEDERVNKNEPERDESVFRVTTHPSRIRIDEDDYSEESHP